MQTERKFGFTNNQLKIIAMAAMLIDHVGVEIFPEHQIFKILGRLAFPIFAYMIAEGCFHTKNRRKYLLMVAGLGVGCQVVYAIVAHSLYQNILLTFTLSIIMIFSIDNYLNKKNKASLIALLTTAFSVVFVSLIAPIHFKEQGFKIDYGFLGVMLPIAVYYAPTKKLKIIFTAIILILRIIFVGEIQIFALATIPLLLLYNGKRGTRNLKYVFYIFYPAHLVLIYLIDMLI